MSKPTRVHLVRHGQVANPDHVLYGRLPGFGLSELGHRMAAATAAFFEGADIAHLRCSPLQRTRETMAPIAARFPHLEVVIDDRVIEGDNVFAGGHMNARAVLSRLWDIRNPLRPSWGESYVSIAARMREAIVDAAAATHGEGDAIIVAHELPIWTARRDAEHRRFAHLPHKRECRLASVTTLTLADGQVTAVAYTEPAAALYPEMA